MRTDALDLDIAGVRMRVVCEDPAGLAFLGAALADHLVDEPAPLGFSLRIPSGRTSFHVLVDRAGSVLARLGSTEDALAVLGSHLAAFIPPPPGTIRLRAQALLREIGRAHV